MNQKSVDNISTYVPSQTGTPYFQPHMVPDVPYCPCCGRCPYCGYPSFYPKIVYATQGGQNVGTTFQQS